MPSIPWDPRPSRDLLRYLFRFSLDPPCTSSRSRWVGPRPRDRWGRGQREREKDLLAGFFPYHVSNREWTTERYEPPSALRDVSGALERTIRTKRWRRRIPELFERCASFQEEGISTRSNDVTKRSFRGNTGRGVEKRHHVGSEQATGSQPASRMIGILCTNLALRTSGLVRLDLSGVHNTKMSGSIRGVEGEPPPMMDLEIKMTQRRMKRA